MSQVGKEVLVNTMDDLFGMLEPDPRWDPVPPKPKPVDPKRKAAVVECEFNGVQYMVERHTHKRDGDDDASDEMRKFWKLFVRDGNAWRRLTLSQDAKIIPDELLYLAEQLLPWAAGATDRVREARRLSEEISREISERGASRRVPVRK